MSDEPVCACGHVRKEHETIRDASGCLHKINYAGNTCSCSVFRPELPWPDSEGWWWMKRVYGPCSQQVVLSLRNEHAEIVVLMLGLPSPAERNGLHERFTHNAGEPARFVKLLEQPPWKE